MKEGREEKEAQVASVEAQVGSTNKRVWGLVEQQVGDDEKAFKPLGAGLPMPLLISTSKTSRRSRLWITRRRRLGEALGLVEEGEVRSGEVLEANIPMSVAALWAEVVDAEASSKGPTSAVDSTKGGAGEIGTRFVKMQKRSFSF